MIPRLTVGSSPSSSLNRVADSDDRLANANFADVSQGKRRKGTGGVNLDIGQVRDGMPSGNVAPVFLARPQLYSNSPLAFNYVFVGDHQPVFADDESRAGAGTRDDLNHAGQRVLGHVRRGFRRECG
jgi:hypothetical protein